MYFFNYFLLESTFTFFYLMVVSKATIGVVHLKNLSILYADTQTYIGVKGGLQTG